MVSTGTVRVDSIASLLNSTASDKELLADAANIIGCKVPGADEILSWKPVLQQQSLDPKQKRVFKWLLLKISKQEAAPGHAIIDPDTYFLLCFLLLRLPTNVVLEHLRHADLFRPIEDCLRYTRIELATSNQNLPINGSVEGSPDADAKKTHILTRLISVCHVLRTIQQMTLSDEHVNLLHQLTRNAVKLSFDHAAAIIGTGLWCTCEAIDHKTWATSVNLEDQVVAPLIAVWDLASERISSNEDALYTARLFAQHCLLPSLQLTLKRPDANLENFIFQHCLLPLKQYGLTNQEKLTETLSIMFISMSQPSLQSNGNGSIGDSTAIKNAAYPVQLHDRIVPNVIPLVVKLLSKLDQIDQQMKKDITAKWHKEVFINLARCLNINLIDPQRQSLSTQASTALVNLLEAFHEVGASPGLSILSNIILFYTDQDFQPFSQQIWRIIKICLDMQYEIVSSTSSQSVQVIEHILDIITAADSQYSTSTIEIDVQRNALEFLLEPLLDALIKGRRFSQFLPLWQECIMKALQRRTEKYKARENMGPQQTFWELSIVQQMIQLRLIEGLSFAERLELFTNFAETVSKSSQNSSDLTGFYSTIIMLTAIVTSLGRADSHLTYAHQALPSALVWELYILVGKYYMATEYYHWKYLLLELLDELRLLTVEEPVSSEITVVNDELIPMLGAQVLDLLDRNGDYDEYECASAAWVSLLLLARDHCISHKVLNQTLRDIVSKVNVSLTNLRTGAASGGYQDALAKSLTTTHNNLGFQGTTDFAYNCVSASIHCTRIYEIVQAAEIQKLMENLYACAFLSTMSRETQTEVQTYKVQAIDPWNKLWQQLTHSDTMMEEMLVYQVIQHTQITFFVNEGSAPLGSRHGDPQTQLAFYEFALDQLSTSHLISITKEDRGSVVNHLVKYINSKKLTGQSLSISLALLCRLTKRPNRLMNIVMDPEMIWTISESFQDTLSFENIGNLRALAENLISYWIVEEFGKESKIRTFTDTLPTGIRKLDKKTISIGGTIVMTTAIAILDRSTHFANLITKELQLQFLESQAQLLTSFPLPSSSDASINLYAILDNISMLPLETCQSFGWDRAITDSGQFTQGISFKDCLISLDDHLRKKTYISIPDDLGLINALCRTKVQHIIVVTSDDHEGFPQYLGEELPSLPHDVMRRRLHELQSAFERLSVKDKAALLYAMSSRAQQLCDDQLSYLQKLASSSFPIDERQDSLKVALQQVFDSSLQILKHSKQPKKMAYALRVICAILDQNPWVINQARIDRALTSITLLVQPKNKLENLSSQDEFTAVVFDQLVKLLSVIFQNHRPKIGGRWALVLDALKGILRCLFVPYSNLSTKDTILQPQWIQGNNSRYIYTRNVSALSRLLSTICDPSYKALRSKATPTNGRQSLNDASKAARAISGQHMQHFIAEFCSLQLKGRMLHRDAIKPGLYAIFDAMSQDVQKALNESLDTQSRIMFKNLYDDWKKFGKWEGN